YITPHRFALIVSLSMTCILLVILLVFHSPTLQVLAILSLQSILSYFVTKYLFKTYLYRNIRLIYKLIYNTRASKKEEYLLDKITPKKSLDEVTEEVISWAQQKNEEIRSLQNNEAFRKEFLQNLAHEIKTPLFTAQGYLYILKDGALEKPENAKKFIDKAAQSIDRLAELTEDIVNISKLESGQTVLDKSFFIIQDLIKDVFEEFEWIRQEKQAQFSFKTGSTAHIQVFADKNRIRQVLINLLQNALKYGQNGIEVSVGCYVLDSDTAYVEISDNGPGIDKNHLPRLFERFYRTDKSRDRQIGGSGLGLAIVKHIIEAHGHTVNVRSTVQVGS